MNTQNNNHHKTISHHKSPSDNSHQITTSLRGEALLRHPRLNKGSAFSDEERREFGLTGLVPLHTSTLEQQLVRTYEGLMAKPNALEKYIFLAALHDRNETLFYRLAQEHITEIMPLIYTPTVGEACQKFSRIFRRSRGVYVSYPERDQLDLILHRSPSGGNGARPFRPGSR